MTTGCRGDAEVTGEEGPPGQRPARLTAWVAGRVQGVGFRWWVRSRALELGLAGIAENLEDGRVRVIAEGSGERCGALLALLRGPGTPGRVSRVTHRWDAPTGRLSGFIERLPIVVVPGAGRRRDAGPPAGDWDAPELGIRQLDRIGIGVGPWKCYLRAKLRSRYLPSTLRFGRDAHSGHSVWRTLHNGEGSIRPRWRAGSPHGFRNAPPPAPST
jgi:acylphosphatase